MASRKRPYLDVKAGILALFRTTARYLHDLTARESIFEKPYLDQDYRQMHLNFPNPDWPNSDIDGGIPDRRKTWTFVWDPGICTLGVASPECGEEFTIGVSIGLLPPGSLVKGIEFKAESSNSDCIEILKIDGGGLGSTSANIVCRAAENCAETTVTVCAKAILSGSIRESLTVPSPFRGTGVLDYRVAASIPALVSTKKSSGYVYDCGCIDIPLDCCGTGAISWDDGVSAETMGQNSSAIVAIVDSGDSGPYTWSISGEGFFLDEGHAKTIRVVDSTSILIYTDGTACGTGTITVTNCDGSSETVGYVRCTEGAWSAYTNLCGSDTPISGCSSLINGKYDYFVRCGCSPIASCEACDALYVAAGINCTAVSACNHSCSTCSCTEPPCGEGISFMKRREWECA